MKKHKAKPEWKKEAIETAHLRRKFHANFGSPNHWHDEKKGEYTDEYFGSLGHIVLREHCKMRNISGCQFAPLYTDNLSELPEWDAKIHNASVEIKTIPPDSSGIRRRRMLVKVSEFKSLDFYLAIKFWDEETYSFCGLASGEEVSSAPVRDFGFAPAHWFFLDQMPREVKGNWWEVATHA